MLTIYIVALSNLLPFWRIFLLSWCRWKLNLFLWVSIICTDGLTEYKWIELSSLLWLISLQCSRRNNFLISFLYHTVTSVMLMMMMPLLPLYRITRRFDIFCIWTISTYHKNLQMVGEHENMLPFLKVLIKKTPTSLVTTVNRKLTFIGLYMSWVTFSLKSRKMT